ncbi:hypothetical protein KPH14_002519 [Odynerus spinipes]|uniref:Uncharacterized protein n=1 Tax=Odynerus spinipes TaxID=1348599 RepID=A0AAD9RSJ3_9HYME|nr:hypothetical protein KPH14_002519 [Odynerus spinipes]
MGEGRRDRSGKRQSSTYGVNKSSSDTELAQDKGKGRKSKFKERWPFADGLTVDELARYRRRRVQGHPTDNVQRPCAESDELDQDLLTEYRRAFRAKSEEFLKENIRPGKSNRPVSFLRLEGAFDNVEPSYQQDFPNYEQVELPSGKAGLDSSFVLTEGDGAMDTQTEQSKFIAHTNVLGRPPIVRRGTSLKREGNFYTDTEMYSAYVAHEGQHRPELARRPTSLKMEGEMETMTEKCEKFIQWLNVSRPELMRVPTHLKLEGELETTTENHDKYVPFVGARRPELLRQGTSLKLEGESTFVPEYADVFKEHAITERPIPRKPETHLIMGDDFFEATESMNNYVNPRVREAQLMAELAREVEEEEKKKREEEEEETRKDKEMQMLVSKLEELKSPPLEIPEYKDAYKDFPRERPKLAKPEDEIGRADGSKVPSSPARSKFSTKIDQDPEYKSKYIDHSKDSVVYRKPPLALRTTGAFLERSTGAYNKSNFYESRRYDYEPTSEVRSQYVPYGHVPRVKPLKMPPNLRLEGSLDLQPEYRNAYCSQRDYRSSSETRKHRNRERSLSASRRKENYWMNSENSERFGCVNAAEDQDAFQVLNTRVHEDSIVGKPPPSNKRGFRISQSQEPMQSNATERPILGNRSPSPTYRLHVCNVDDEPRGFGQRKRSPPMESSERPHDQLPDRLNRNDVHRSYSPSFGRNPKQQLDGQSFVVLDNAPINNNKLNKRETRRRRMDKNYNVENNLAAARGRPRTPTKWMPPWYDSTNTI